MEQILTRRMNAVLTRRHFLAVTAMVPVAACAGVAGLSTIVPAAAAGIQALGQYLAQNVLPGLQAAGAKIPASLSTIINDIVTVAAGVSTASTQAAGTGALQTIEGYLNEFAPLVTPFLSLIPGVGPFIGIAITALPEIEALINLGVSLLTPVVKQLAVTTTTAPAARRMMAARVGASAVLTPQQALDIMLHDTGH